jgi:DNA-binding CsgD family transcriptional regulator
MQCSNCGTENGADAKFCGSCGNVLTHACPACGKANAPGMRFCTECGTPVIDRRGRIRWLNRGASDVVGARVGQPFALTVAPEDLHIARGHFATKLTGEAGSTEYKLTLLARDGGRLAVHVSSVPFWEGGEITGVFGVAYPARARVDGTPRSKPAAAAPELTARQYEALALLADGLGTRAIATRLGIAEKTARNHIRGVFSQLGVHSRLEAVVRAYRLGLLQPRRDD